MPIIASPWTQQPQSVAALNAENVRAPRSVWCAGREIHGPLATAYSTTTSSSVVAGEDGLYLNGGAYVGQLVLSKVDPDELTVLCITRRPASFTRVFDAFSQDGSSQPILYLGSGNNTIVYYVRSSSATVNMAVTGYAEGDLLCVAMVYRRDAGLKEFWINGALVGTDTSNVSTGLAGKTMARYCVGASWESYASPSSLGSKTFLQVLDETAWPAERCERATSSPAEMYSAVFAPRKIYVPFAAAGPSLPTLSASTYKAGTLSSSGWTPQITAT